MNKEKKNNTQHKAIEKQHSNSAGFPQNVRVISYNLNKGERPGGMKVRYKIRVVSGKRADAIDARQTAVIQEVLQWAQRHKPRPGTEP